MFVMTTHWLSCHKLKMKLENIFGDHIKKKCTALLGFIWVRWRDRRPGLLLKTLLIQGIHVSHSYSCSCLFSCLWVPKTLPDPVPRIIGQKKVDNEEWMVENEGKCTTADEYCYNLKNGNSWLLVFVSQGAGEEIAKCSLSNEINKYQPSPSPSIIKVPVIWMLFVWLDRVFPLHGQFEHFVGRWGRREDMT